MTPAEKVAAAKPPRKCTRAAHSYPWVCALKAARRRLLLTMRDVAQGAGLSLAALSEIERGADPKLSTATRLADFFGMTIGELWPKRKPTGK